MKIIYENTDTNPTSLEEASTSRLVNNIINDDISFAVISACIPNEDNKTRTKHLNNDVSKLGLGFNEFIARWVENGESFDEESLLITGITEKQAFKLGQKYSQSSIIYKDAYGLREICTTPFEDYDIGDIVRGYHVDPDMPLDTNLAQEIFLRSKEGPASLLKKGSDRKPFKFNESFELYEKQLLNSRLGFTHTRINLNENTAGKVKKALFGDITGKIRTFAIISPERAQSTVDTDSKVDPSTLKFKDTFGRGSFNKKQRITSFKNSMKYASLQYFPVTGKYGSKEQSYIIINIPLKLAERLADDFDQESFFFGETHFVTSDTKDRNTTAHITYYESASKVGFGAPYKAIKESDRVISVPSNDTEIDFYTETGNYKFNIADIFDEHYSEIRDIKNTKLLECFLDGNILGHDMLRATRKIYK